MGTCNGFILRAGCKEVIHLICPIPLLEHVPCQIHHLSPLSGYSLCPLYDFVESKEGPVEILEQNANDFFSISRQTAVICFLCFKQTASVVFPTHLVVMLTR